MQEIIELKQVKKVIQKRTIIEDFNFSIEPCTAVWVVGKNGSGKSTLLKLIAGIYEPTSGVIKRNAQTIAYVPEHFPVLLRFRLKEYLMHTAAFHGRSFASIEQDLAMYSQLFGLDAFLQVPLSVCSKGTKQKAGLLQALLMKPDLLLLDEPLTGLDKEAQQTLLQQMRELNPTTTILYTAHELGAIRQIATHVLSIETGELKVNQKPNFQQKVIRVRCPNEQIITSLNVSPLSFEDNIATLLVDSTQSDQLLYTLLQENCSIVEVKENIK